MKLRLQTLRFRAFTLIELLAVLLIIALLAAVLVPALTSGKRKAKRIKCVSNLKNIGLSLRIFATDNTNRFPMQIAAPRNELAESHAIAVGHDLSRYFRMISNELSTPKILICPSDIRQEGTNFADLKIENTSYFIGLDLHESQPQMLLAGDRNLTTNGVPVPTGVVALTTNIVVGWSRAIHNRQGNVAMGDGSVQQLSIPRLQELITDSGEVTNRLLIP